MQWHNIKLILMFAVAACFLQGCTSACSERVMPGQVAKVLTTSGYQPGIHQPGYVTCWGRDRIVLLDVTTSMVREEMDVKMADDLTLKFDVRARIRIDEANIGSLFQDLKPHWQGARGTIDIAAVYNTYGQMLVRNVCRSVMSDYTVMDVSKDYKNISAKLKTALTESFTGVPLVLEDVSIGKVEYPPQVTQAFEIKAQKEIELGQIEADKQKELAAKDAERAIAQAQREIDLTKAETMRDYNRIIGEGLSENWVIFRHFEVLEKMADNGSAVFMPYEAYRPDNAGLTNRLNQAQTEAQSNAR